MNELAQLVDDLGRRSFDARLGHRGLPDTFDEALWRNLEDTGLARLTSSQDAGPGGGGDRVVRLGKTCGRGSDRRDRPARGVAGGQGRLAGARCRSADGGDRRCHRDWRPDHRNRPRSAMAFSDRSAGGADGRCAARRVDRGCSEDRWPQPGGRTARVSHVRCGGRRYAHRRRRRRRRADPPRRVGALQSDRRCARCRVRPHRRAHQRAGAVRTSAQQVSGRAAFAGRDGRRDRTGTRRNGFGGRRGNRLRLRPPCDRLRRDGGEGGGRPSRSLR